MLAPKRIHVSTLLGTLKLESANSKSTRCLHFSLNGMERDGMSDVTLGSTMASMGRLLPKGGGASQAMA